MFESVYELGPFYAVGKQNRQECIRLNKVCVANNLAVSNVVITQDLRNEHVTVDIEGFPVRIGRTEPPFTDSFVEVWNNGRWTKIICNPLNKYFPIFEPLSVFRGNNTLEIESDGPADWRF